MVGGARLHRIVQTSPSSRSNPCSRSMPSRKPTPTSRPAASKGAPLRRGRPPRKVYINVLVKASTREGLTRLKAAGELASQGEVIDLLIAQALGRDKP